MQSRKLVFYCLWWQWKCWQWVTDLVPPHLSWPGGKADLVPTHLSWPGGKADLVPTHLSWPGRKADLVPTHLSWPGGKADLVPTHLSWPGGKADLVPTHPSWPGGKALRGVFCCLLLINRIRLFNQRMNCTWCNQPKTDTCSNETVTIMTISIAMYVCFMKYADMEWTKLRSIGGTLVLRLARPDAGPYTGESGMTEPLSLESNDRRCRWDDTLSNTCCYTHTSCHFTRLHTQ